jgi:D-alanine transaminase
MAKVNVKAVGLLPALLSMNALPSNAVESIFYDEEKRTVRECAASNIFAIKDGVIYTPPLSKYILPGIERQTAVNIARANNLPLKEEDISIDFLKSADEVFMTSTTKEVLPVKKVDDVEIKNTPGPVTRKLIELFAKYVEKEIGFTHPKRKLGWF